MTKVKETMRKSWEEDLQQNRYWLNHLYNADRYEVDPSKVLSKEADIDGLTAKQVQDAAKKYFDPGNFGKFVLYPEVQKGGTLNQKLDDCL